MANEENDRQNERIARLEAQREGDKDRLDEMLEIVRDDLKEHKIDTDRRFDELKELVIRNSLFTLIKENKLLANIVGVLTATRLLGFELKDVIGLVTSVAKAVYP